jgi:hypothetical protein
MSDDLHVNVRSIFGRRRSAGSSSCVSAARRLQITPAKAREIAAFLVEASTAAEGDETLMRVLARAGMSAQRSAHILMAMRAERGILERRARDEARQAIANDQTDPDQPE